MSPLMIAHDFPEEDSDKSHDGKEEPLFQGKEAEAKRERMSFGEAPMSSGCNRYIPHPKGHTHEEQTQKEPLGAAPNGSAYMPMKA
jgi:hypothetical protein